VTLDDEYFTLPAKVVKIEDTKILLTITEGKFHQVKRMLEAV
jgi:16S rRNA pseudouridine516 synthase